MRDPLDEAPLALPDLEESYNNRLQFNGRRGRLRAICRRRRRFRPPCGADGRRRNQP